MFQSVNFFRASVLNSSHAAFSLALENSSNLKFAKNIIKAKNANAYTKLNALNNSRQEMIDQNKYFKTPNSLISYCCGIFNTELKISKYENILQKIDYIQHKTLLAEPATPVLFTKPADRQFQSAR